MLPRRVKLAAPISNPGPNMVKGSLAVQHHFDRGSDPEFSDCPDWNRASYNHHPCHDFEPMPDVVSDYREAALHFCRIMYCVDEFATESIDTRLAIVSVGIVLRWPSVRGLSIDNISDQLGCTPATL